MLIRRKARLVYCVTDEFRQQMAGDLMRRRQRVEAALSAVDAALSEAESSGGNVQDLQRRRLALVQARDRTSSRLIQLEAMGSGDELAAGFVEIVSDIAVGDSEERLREAQIVIRDGVVVEIRNQ